MKLHLSFPINDEVIECIASCVDKIEELKMDAGEVTICGWVMLSSAISNRPNPVR